MILFGFGPVNVKQTFYKAKRRIGFVDEIRKEISDVEIELYFMNPSEQEWNGYINQRGMFIEATMSKKDDIEMPNIAERFDAVYEVKNNKIQKLVGIAQPEIVEKARQELLDEKERLLLDKNRAYLAKCCMICGKILECSFIMDRIILKGEIL